ncbi:hypothetical protein UPYG_G00038970 [Umbra pygmaea]|uniref:ribonuclease H n=1 Tax=Umbra pygmaea TaxID=75934 RepID=A0ABD0XPJ7_UMBPY
MNEVFRDLLNQSVVVYIDDILVFSSSYDQHVQHVREVLTRLRAHQLFVKAEKCQFHQRAVSFLGYGITDSGVRMEEDKVEAVRSWPVPSTVKEEAESGGAKLRRG